jgi:hypothetical protein
LVCIPSSCPMRPFLTHVPRIQSLRILIRHWHGGLFSK